MKPPEPGLHPDIPFEEYVAWPLLSNSKLGLMEKSPAHFHHGGLEAKPEQKFGTAGHTCILEPPRYAREYVTGPDVKLNTKAGKLKWAHAETAADGRTLLRFNDGVLAETLRDSAHRVPFIHDLLSGAGRNELSIVWDCPHTGVRCKGRLDRFTTVDGYTSIVDLKCMADASRAKFSRSVAGFGYHRQAAMYLDGLAALDPDRDIRRRYIFLVGEKSGCCPFGVYELDDESLRTGRILYISLLRRYLQCKETDYWPGYTDNEVESISIPKWDQIEEGVNW